MTIETTLKSIGAISTDRICIDSNTMKELVREAEKINCLSLSPEVSGTKWGAINTASGKDWYNIDDLPSKFKELVAQLTDLIKLNIPERNFSEPLIFNEFSLRKYPKNSETQYSISPHRDNDNYINIVIVCVLKGESNFFICKNKSDAGEKVLTSFGQPIIMRGNNFAGIKDRPYHYVTSTDSERISFTLRQKSK